MYQSWNSCRYGQGSGTAGAHAVQAGYWSLYRYNPMLEAEGKNPFQLDSKEPDFTKFQDFLDSEVRYTSLKKAFPVEAAELFKAAEENAKWRHNSYRRMAGVVLEPKNKRNLYNFGAGYFARLFFYRALCYQAYNLGKIMLDKDLGDKDVNKHRIIILDVDETVLDNSPYQAQCILDNVNYPVGWEEWCNKAIADAIPGSLDFLNYARANGVSVFYVTNRKDVVKEATIANLKKLGFPHADAEHVITRSAENSKEGRRNALADKFHISLFFGDNLSDFSYVFDDKPNAERYDQVEKLKSEFGSRFIILPNSMYGDWELALYNMKKQQSDSLKSALRYKGLKGF
jgi:5'-nucleotidase (lipoprotein e(P4) family)